MIKSPVVFITLSIIFLLMGIGDLSKLVNYLHTYSSANIPATAYGLGYRVGYITGIFVKPIGAFTFSFLLFNKCKKLSKPPLSI